MEKINREETKLRKEELWSKKLKEIEKVVDALDEPIDPDVSTKTRK